MNELLNLGWLSFAMEQSIFHKNAETLNELMNAINVSFVNRDRDENHYALWTSACQRFHASFNDLAFPGGLDRQLSSLKRQDARSVEMAVRFLEADPWFFRSGYIKEELLQALRTVPLTPDQQERLQAVIIERINKGSGREFRRYCRLARRLVTASFVAQIQEAMMSDEPNISRRAGWVMNALESEHAIQHVLGANSP